MGDQLTRGAHSVEAVAVHRVGRHSRSHHRVAAQPGIGCARQADAGFPLFFVLQQDGVFVGLHLVARAQTDARAGSENISSIDLKAARFHIFQF